MLVNHHRSSPSSTTATLAGSKPSSRPARRLAPMALLPILALALTACTGTREPVASRTQPTVKPASGATSTSTPGTAAAAPLGPTAPPSAARPVSFRTMQDPFGAADMEGAADRPIEGWSAPWTTGATARGPVDVAPARADSPDLSGGIPGEVGAAALSEPLDGLAQLTFANEGSDFDPRVSADGRWLIFASTQHRPTPDLYIKAVGSRTVTQLTSDPASDVMPALSADGSRVAFASNRTGFWNLYVMSATGGQAVQLTSQNTHELHPSWSPDGKRLAFCRLGQMSGRWEIWVMDVAQPQVAEFVAYGLFPEWSPKSGGGRDGADQILFQRGRERGDRAFSLWTIDYKPGDASNLTEVVAVRGLAAINGSWSPDGTWIAYSTVPVTTPGARPRGADLWISRLDGAGRVNVTGGRFANLAPAWGPDQRLYFVSNRGGIENVWTASVGKAVAAGAATGPATAMAPSFRGEPEMNAQAPTDTPATPAGEVANAPTP